MWTCECPGVDNRSAVHSRQSLHYWKSYQTKWIKAKQDHQCIHMTSFRNTLTYATLNSKHKRIAKTLKCCRVWQTLQSLLTVNWGIATSWPSIQKNLINVCAVRWQSLTEILARRMQKKICFIKLLLSARQISHWSNNVAKKSINFQKNSTIQPH